MASTIDFVEFVMGELAGLGDLRMRKMFGEYTVYVNEKPIVLICDDTVFLKMVPELAELMADAETGYPYDGASLRYILDMDNRQLAREAVAILESMTPVPKAKGRIQSKDNNL